MAKTKKQKASHHSCIHATTVRGIQVKINYQTYTDGSTTLRGYLVDAKTGLRHDSDIESTITAKNEEQIADMEKLLIGRLTTAYVKATVVKPTVTLTDAPYTQAFNVLSPDLYHQLFLPSWRAESTKRQALSYFRQTMLPLLDHYGLEIDAISLNEILAQMKKAAEENANHTGNPYTANETVIRHAKDFNYMYAALRNLLPEFGLPELELPVPQKIKGSQKEQIKAFTVSMRIRLAVILLRLISNGLATGGVLMLTTMVRTAEACAPTFGDIVFYENYAVYGVLWQSRGTVRIANLKSDKSYRIVVLPKYAVDALQLRMAWLREQGYSETEILKMPVVSAPGDPTVMADPKVLSAFLKRLLMLLGCDDEYWSIVNTTMTAEPDREDDGRTPSRDPSAYVLRRNGCTMYCNSGMNPDLVDALMGHKLSASCRDRWDHYIRRPDNWPMIAEQMERVIFDPRHSAHPLFSPISLKTETQETIKTPQMGFSFLVASADSEMEIEITAESLEAGDSIILESPARGTKVLDTSVCAPAGTRIPILGRIEEESYYTELIQEAEVLDVSSFLPTQKIPEV